jgi:ligand-binding sensor domain-containing protein
MRCFLLIFIILSGVSGLRGQDFIFKHYDLQHGLPSPTIHSIFQDRDGFLWFGTESGLCRYDGTNFKIFTLKDGLAGNEVFGMYQDRKGRLWLQQYKNSVVYIYNGKVHNQQNDSLLKKFKLTSRIHGIAEDKDGRITICDNESVFQLDKREQSLTKIKPAPAGETYFVNLYTDAQGDVVVCTRHDLYKVTNGRLQLHIQGLLKNTGFGPTDILLDPRYIAFRADALTSIYLKDTILHTSLPKLFYIKYSPISDSVFSINTIDGAVLYNINTHTYFQILPGIKVSNVYLDKEQNLWIGTLGKGIYKLSSQQIRNHKISEGQNDIVYINKVNGPLVVGNSNGRIYEYHNNVFTHKNAISSNKLSFRKVFYYELLGAGRFLLAHSMGLVGYDAGKLPDECDMPMLKSAALSDAQNITIAGDFGLLDVAKSGFHITNTIWERRTLSFLKSNDTVWTGTARGLFLLKKEGSRYVVKDSLFTTSIIAYMKKSEDNLLWVSTYEDGLYCLRDGKVVHHFSDTSGLPANNGRSLFIHGNDVWHGTDRGLVKISRNGDGFKIRKFSTSDGLPSNTVNSVYVDDGMVYIGTPEGLCSFDERKIETTSLCNLVLTSVTIGEKPAAVASRYFLDRNEQINISFSGISFRSEQEMNYRYRIRGLDEHWRNTRANALEFTSLPYGRYTLEIIAVNKFNKESAPVIISLQIRRPFYESAWFIILIGLALFSTILILYSRRLTRIKRKQMQKLQQEMRMMELEQMALRAQMNPHFIFNCINVMQQLVADNDKENGEKFLLSFSTLVRQTLENAGEVYIPVNEEIKFLSSYLELEKIRLEDRFTYVIKKDDSSDIDKLAVPNMVIQPFVENAVRHGIRYKKNGPGFIELIFQQAEGVLRCHIIDNGIGRERAEEIRKELGNTYISKGMNITFRRIQLLNAMTPDHISVSIHDEKDGHGNPAGTKVIIEFRKNAKYN